MGTPAEIVEEMRASPRRFAEVVLGRDLSRSPLAAWLDKKESEMKVALLVPLTKEERMDQVRGSKVTNVILDDVLTAEPCLSALPGEFPAGLPAWARVQPGIRRRVHSAGMLVDQLSAIASKVAQEIDSAETTLTVEELAQIGDAISYLRSIFSQHPISAWPMMGLREPTIRVANEALMDVAVTTLGQYLERTPAELLALPGVGKTALAQIEANIAYMTGRPNRLIGGAR